MYKTTHTAMLLLALSLPLIGACSQPSPPPKAATASTTGKSTEAAETMIGRAAEKGLRKAREELENGNLSLNGGVHVSQHGKTVWSDEGGTRLPKAEITPKGDLLIEGKSTAIDAGQRATLLTYRRQVIDVAEAGMAIGVQGADLAGKAMSEGLANIFSVGDKDEFERRMDANGKKIEAQARLLCDRLPPMLATQEKLAASLPAFKPYARMTREDIDDCMEEHKGSGVTGDTIRHEIRQNLRDGVRGTLRVSSDSAADDAKQDDTRSASAR